MFIHRIKLKNLLSFGPKGLELELKPLNVLIGPNGSGKSNFIEMMGLLKAVPEDLHKVIEENGGCADWMWHGEPRVSSAELEIAVAGPDAGKPLRYYLLFSSDSGRFRLIEERLEDEPGQPGADPCVYLHSDGAQATARSSDPGERASPTQSRVHLTTLYQPALPLSNFKDPARYPELAYMTDGLGRISLYRHWSFGRHTPTRSPQKPDRSSDFLVEDLRNLGLVLNRLMRDPEVRQRLLKALGDLYEGVSDFHVDIEYDTVQIFLREEKVEVPATRLSDGTLRHLCLLVILCHPDPPPLVCIEEPELGLHPDILPGLADLLREASERCQLIVTTHSDVLVDALTDTPESIVVCEKHEGQTTLRRLDKESLAHWVQEYRLGELWTSGELGGNRW